MALGLVQEAAQARISAGEAGPCTCGRGASQRRQGIGRLGLGAVKGWSVDEPCTRHLPDERGSKERRAADLARDSGMARRRIQAWGRKAAEDWR